MMNQIIQIPPNTRVNLADFDPGYSGDWEREAAEEQLDANVDRLQDLQNVLYAEDKHALLIVLQAMDAGGKDGTIRHVMGKLNPQGVKVASFKVPTRRELAHDFLWRIHQQTPGRGEIMVFNRSHYEDVLVVRVHNLVPPAVWGTRYDHINAFEQLLADNGVTIRKFFLHISKREQRERFEKRLENPRKNWKFSRGDLRERMLWDDYQAAYEDALSRCSTDHAPWYVIPADKKWYRNLIISQILVETLEALDMRYPPGEPDLDQVVIPD
jgi:PPK2 family polyphosphate:nucleotide phosphotransferase